MYLRFTVNEIDDDSGRESGIFVVAYRLRNSVQLPGYQAEQLAERTGGRLRLSAGTLYGSIKRLLEQGFIVELPEDDERRRRYRLTPLGRKTVKAEMQRMAELLAHARAHGLAAKSI